MHVKIYENDLRTPYLNKDGESATSENHVIMTSCRPPEC